jgi:hypothetical protein
MPLQELDTILKGVKTRATSKLKSREELGIEPSPIKRGAIRAKESLETGVEDIKRGIQPGLEGQKLGFGEFLRRVVFPTGAGIVKGTIGRIEEAVVGALEPQIESAIETAKDTPIIPGGMTPRQIGQAIPNEVKTKTAESIQKISEAMSEEDKQLASDIFNTLRIFDFIPEGFVLKKAGKEIIEQVPKAIRIAKEGVEEAKSLFKAPVKSVDDVIEQSSSVLDVAVKPTATGKAIREVAEETAPTISITEKWAGVRPDIKKRIAGKQDKLKEYFDIAHARNLDDTAPTPLEWGARQAESARDTLKGVLNDTGSEIGKFRMEIATQTIPTKNAMNNIKDEFVSELGKLNLSLDNGVVSQVSGKVKKASKSEIKLLNSLYEDFLTVKGNQTMENLIDLRNAFDAQINFAKTAGEASNVIDPLSRSVRAKIKEINKAAIGVDQSKLLDDYSDLIGLLDEMNKFVDSRSGGEFLLKRVLSERGRVPREIMQKLKDYTDIDLMDDAVMAQLATEIIGNEAQKGLFRQEITKAGLGVTDIIAIAKGKPPIGVGATLIEKGKEIIAPVEETFIKAAEKVE